ncbi:hypothetical protein DENSPDRAFT_316464 [Dentipellis sp. KUC8613]|nr:hypothetical protein DENSPDRAFT_316464 [Dentipellis sp. KUC8613]
MSGPLMIDLFHKFVITAMALSFLLAGNIISFTELTGVLSFRLLMIFPVIAIVSDTIGLFAASLTVVPGTALILYGVLSAGLSAGWLVGLVKASNQAHSFNLRADMDNTCACGAQLMNSVVGWMGASFALHVVSVMTSLWRAYHKEALRWRQPAGDTDQQQLDNL